MLLVEEPCDTFEMLICALWRRLSFGMSKGRSLRSTDVADPDVSCTEQDSIWRILRLRSLGMSKGRSLNSSCSGGPTRERTEIPESLPLCVSSSTFRLPRKTLRFCGVLLFFCVSLPGVTASSGDAFSELLFLLFSDASLQGSWEDLSEIGERTLSLFNWKTRALNEDGILERKTGAAGGAVSELCELNELLCRLSQLDVDRFPSLVLLFNDSRLPPELEVAIDSLLEYFVPLLGLLLISKTSLPLVFLLLRPWLVESGRCDKQSNFPRKQLFALGLLDLIGSFKSFDLIRTSGEREEDATQNEEWYLVGRDVEGGGDVLRYGLIPISMSSMPRVSFSSMPSRDLGRR